ncbi:ABC-three component system middle component 1 [Erwinia tasmaniensis]|uniref:Uncharacterized protein n=1 Tax=Erwinia tasmaniensis (strain DSM 17950 / CFBP 7177 / CIP 109463 / NCPPB 4357 / Et1/99) TaxID=465817 RepID=B2VEV9_ERWT9|nr:ABC-three component system middle component 1 [Erwinia tasmaniensis]CAO96784.1 hypothetical protein ETA_17380 [Erwinia tasmaniensis Et1/99]
MNNVFESFLFKLLDKEEWALAKIDNITCRDFTTAAVLARKGGRGDFFMFVSIPQEEMQHINKVIQIELLGGVKTAFLSPESDVQLHISLEEEYANYKNKITLTHEFNQDTNLIILSPCGNNDTEALRHIVEIEENEFFFKKHVIRMSPGLSVFLAELSQLSDSDKVINDLNHAVNDDAAYKDFISGKRSKKDTRFICAAHLFEKLPFLNLKIKESRRQPLIDKIKKELEKKEVDYDFVERILQMNTDDEMFSADYEKWKSEVLNEK